MIFFFWLLNSVLFFNELNAVFCCKKKRTYILCVRTDIHDAGMIKVVDASICVGKYMCVCMCGVSVSVWVGVCMLVILPKDTSVNCVFSSFQNTILLSVISEEKENTKKLSGKTKKGETEKLKVFYLYYGFQRFYGFLTRE